MIRLYTRNRQLEKLVHDALTGMELGTFEVLTPAFIDRPRAAQYLVTKSALNARIEGYAARLGAYCVVLPEGLPWLLERIAGEHATGIETKIIGSDYAQQRGNGD